MYWLHAGTKEGKGRRGASAHMNTSVMIGGGGWKAQGMPECEKSILAHFYIAVPRCVPRCTAVIIKARL